MNFLKKKFEFLLNSRPILLIRFIITCAVQTPKLPLSKLLYLLVEVAGLLANCLSAMITRSVSAAFLYFCKLRHWRKNR